MRAVLLLAISLCVAGCATDAAKPQHAAQPGWRSLATEEDRERVSKWRTAWIEALEKATTAGKSAEIAREGALLRPDAALPWQAPPPGDYSCRIIKIGAKSEGLLDYVDYPPFLCRIEQGETGLRFAKLTGSQRPVGRLFPGNGDRMIFLGTLQLSDERGVHAYGEDRERDMAGVLERIGENRWRLAFPYPHFESTIDVMELSPRGS